MSDPREDRGGTLLSEERARAFRLLLERRGLESRRRPRIEAGPLDEPAPLSYSQRRLWLLQKLDPENPSFSVPLVLEVEGSLELRELREVLAEIQRRHAVLRSRIVERGDGEPMQRVEPVAEPPLGVVDLGGLPEAVAARAARRAAVDETGTPFDLQRDVPVRFRLLRLTAQRQVLVTVFHHSAADGWSTGIFVRELRLLLAAQRGDGPAPPEPPVQYADFARWQRQHLSDDVLDRQLDYWRTRLEDAPEELALPFDRPRPVRPTHLGGQRAVSLDPDLTGALRRLATDEGASMLMVLLAGLQALFSRYSGQSDVSVGVPFAGRTEAAVEDLIGMFANRLVVRTDLADRPGFRTLVRQVRRLLLEAEEHAELPFERLVEELAPERSLSRAPLFQVFFLYESADGGRPGSGPEATDGGGAPIRLRGVGLERRLVKFDLTVSVLERPEDLSIAFDYSVDLFDATSIERMLRHLRVLLSGAIAAPAAPVEELSLLAPAERHALVHEWNDSRERLADRCLHELVLDRAAAAPDAVAVIFDDRAWTYAELAARAGGVFRRLRERGVGAGSRVLVAVERSPEMVAAVVGVLATGAAYVPIDPAVPAGRAEWILRDAGAGEALVGAEEMPAWLEDGPTPLRVAEIPGAPGALPGPDLDPAATAAVIYTSGSTGRPKGVALAHRPLVNRILWGGRVYPVGAEDTVLQKASLGFDFSIWEIFAPLVAGGRLCLARPDGQGDVAYLAELLAREQVTLVHFVPSVLGVLLEQDALRESLEQCRMHTVFSGAEALPADLAARFTERLGRPTGAILRNQYGPTEAAIDVSHEVYGAGPVRDSVPIGRPIANVALHVVDADLRLALPGAVGELAIAGRGLADGYVRSAGATAERFVPDPFGGTAGGRLYRTGDLVRRLPDGRIEFQRRRDDQLKLRGLRIEPGEIEAALRSAPEVVECAVAVREGAAGEPILVAYVTAPSREDDPELGRDLRRLLSRTLPRHMVPSVFMALDGLPRTSSGKLDRRALPAPTPEDETGPPGSPRTPVEEEVVRVWQEVLGLERVGVDDGFFALGGHSLLAIRVASRLAATFGVDVALRHVFETASAGELAERIEQLLRGDRPRQALPLEPVPRGETLRPSFAQERLWFLDRLAPGRGSYNVPLAIDLHGALDPESMRRALEEIVRRHEVLRTGFREEGGRPVLEIRAPERLELPWVDLLGVPEAERETRAHAAAVRFGATPFDLADPPLLRLALLRLAPARHVLLVTFHHIVSDAWSRDVFYRELSTLYKAFRGGHPSPLPEPRIQYADFAQWQRAVLSGDRLQEEMEYWRERLAGRPERLELPTDRPRPAFQNQRGGRRSFALPPALVDGIAALGRSAGATPFMTFLAGYQALLARLTGQRDLVVGTPISGRNHVETEGMIGFFLNTLALRVEIPAAAGFADLIARARHAALGAYSHLEIPFEMLVEELEPSRSLARAPLVQAMFVFVGDRQERRMELPGLEWSATTTEVGAAKFDLTLALAEEGERLHGVFEYDADLFDATTMDRWAHHLERLLESALEAPEAPLESLALLGPGERHQVVIEWGRGGPGPADRSSVPGRVAERASRMPDGVAVACGREWLSYGELLRRADRLAGRLRNAGLGPEDRVGLPIGPSVDLVVALLGVLRAGCAYLPLDPSLPAERLRGMVRDAGVRALVTLPGAEVPDDEDGPLRIALHRAPTAGGPDEPRTPERDGGPDLDGALAYVIFTSGSTGRPKGVEIPHRGLAALVDWHLEAYRPSPGDRVSQSAGVGFDAVVWELWPSLVAGATVQIADLESRRGAERMAEWLARHRLTSAFLSTPVAEGLLGSGSVPPELERLLTGGDRLTVRPASGASTDLVNHYGPTESSVVTTAETVRAGVPGLPTIGRPIRDRQVRLLDASLRPVPAGIAGELCIGGAGLARGYSGLPGRTAESFVPDPEGAGPGERLYRSGDLARARPDGRLEFLGRIDRQVKVRGFRIEPGEIEAAMMSHPQVAEAVVEVRGEGERRRLVAYVVAAGEGTDADADSLRTYLGTRLPDYMVPSHALLLDALPLTANGKVDRRALSELEVGPIGDDRTHVAPEGPLEELLADVWCEVLELDAVGVLDDFFALGGHSLLATRLLWEIEQLFRVQVPLRRFFEQPTVRGLAEHLAEAYGDRSLADEVATTLLELDELSPEEMERLAEEPP